MGDRLQSREQMLADLTTTAQGEVVQAGEETQNALYEAGWNRIRDALEAANPGLTINLEGRARYRLRDLFVPRDHRLAFSHPSGEVERLREALRQIASCESHVSGDVVSIARAALSTPETVSLKGDRV